MSMTIFGNTTLNNVPINDMVDDNHDEVWFIKDTTERYFVRFTAWRDNVEDEPKPALAVFATNDTSHALWGRKLDGGYLDYCDKDGNMTDRFTEELKLFEEEFKEEYIGKCLSRQREDAER